MDSMNAIRAMGGLIRGLQRDGSGTTVAVHAGVPLDSIDGYVVGGIVPSLVLPSGEFPQVLQDPAHFGTLAHWLLALPDDVLFVGAWQNDGQYHFDAVAIFSNLDLALKSARLRGEIAIWDGFRQEEIVVGAD